MAGTGFWSALSLADVVDRRQKLGALVGVHRDTVRRESIANGGRQRSVTILFLFCGSRRSSAWKASRLYRYGRRSTGCSRWRGRPDGWLARMLAVNFALRRKRPFLCSPCRPVSPTGLAGCRTPSPCSSLALCKAISSFFKMNPGRRCPVRVFREDPSAVAGGAGFSSFFPGDRFANPATGDRGSHVIAATRVARPAGLFKILASVVRPASSGSADGCHSQTAVV